MRAVRLVQVGKALEQADIPIPEVGSSDVLIRVAAAGICHSDAHYRAGISKIDSLPVTLGHEVAGRVEKLARRLRTSRREIAFVFTISSLADAVIFVNAAWN